MVALPTFFFSHARQDRERSLNNYLEKFYEDLEARVASLDGIDLEEASIGIIDRETSQGEDWDRRLGKALSTNRAFVSIFTPLYFKRPSCGKELFVFLMRSKAIGIDTNGALTGVENVVPIRWEIKEAYFNNTEANSVIPLFLRLLNDRPSDPGGDSTRTAAIKFYYERGMRNCVASEPHYSILLDSIALRIRNLKDLPEGPGASFSTTENAFAYDWRKHFAGKGATAAPVPPTARSQPIVPKPLLSVVAFYVTRRDFDLDPAPVDFADQLIGEPMGSETTSAKPEFTELLTDVRGAGIQQGLNVFHAAANPKVPTDPKLLLDRLKSLATARVLTLLLVDSDIWPGNGDASASAIEEIARSPEWTGLVLISPVGGIDMDIDKLANQRGLPARFVMLPRKSDERAPVLQRALVHLRGRVLSGSAETLPGAEPVPLLKGVAPTRGTVEST
jgi:hypothetical protein